MVTYIKIINFIDFEICYMLILKMNKHIEQPRCPKIEQKHFSKIAHVRH
ncbi:protein of unknown function [Xenorhabdus poinarii G6]|uniref:Uncharacterized protein n=1 Tax=Xenorhabdus poinarii G6 TaxID=1354304 RepID=A0A068R1M2_9GAMM|nr:protein of unknown function [Xenorhabdus poinarii G6]